MKSAWFCWRELVEMEFLRQMLLNSRFLGSKKPQKSQIFGEKVKIFTKWVEKKHFWTLRSGIDAVF